MSIYRYERRIWSIIEGPKGIKKTNKITPANKKTLLEYATYLKAAGKSPPRQDKLLRTVKILAQLLGSIPFKEANKKDLVGVLAKYEASVKNELENHHQITQDLTSRRSLSIFTPGYTTSKTQGMKVILKL